MLEKVKNWLQTFPKWEGNIQVDFVDGEPGNTGLYPRGITELSRREDVLGNLKLRCRCDFLLRRTTVSGEANAQWLLEFQNWVMGQDRLGLAPKFGDEPKTEHIRAGEGKLDRHAQAGSALYTVLLQAEFTKIYEVK